MQNSEGAQCIPAASPGDIGLHLQRNLFRMKKVEGPASVLVAARYDNFDGFPDAVVGFDSGTPHIIESAQNVVVPKHRVGEAEASVCQQWRRYEASGTCGARGDSLRPSCGPS